MFKADVMIQHIIIWESKFGKKPHRFAQSVWRI